MALPHVLIVLPYYAPRIGGAETHVRELATGLARLGHTVTVFTQCFPGMPTSETDGAVEVRRFGDALTESGRLQAYAEILEAVGGRGFERSVLYLYLSVGPEHATRSMLEIVSTWHSRNRPVVVRISSSGRVTELLLQEPVHAKELCKADAVVALNSGICRELKQAGVPPERIYRIPNGVDRERFCPLGHRAAAEARCAMGGPACHVLLSVSRYASKKRIPRLIELWAQLAKHNRRTRSWELWVVGDDRYEASRGQISAEVEALIDRLKPMGLRRFPAVPHSEIHRFFQVAHAYVTLSTQEGMSNAMLEAMATALPVVAPDCDFTRDLLAEGLRGFIFDPAAPCSAHDALLNCLGTDRARLRQMGERNRGLISRKYGLDDMRRRFSVLFTEVCQRQGGLGACSGFFE